MSAKKPEGSKLINERWGRLRLLKETEVDQIDRGIVMDSADELKLLVRRLASGRVALHELSGETVTAGEIGEIPDTAQKLLPFLLSKKLRDAVTGDLTEDFRFFATKWGRPYALKWLCWQIAVIAIKRVSPAVILAGVATWCRQKLGL